MSTYWEIDYRIVGPQSRPVPEGGQGLIIRGETVVFMLREGPGLTGLQLRDAGRQDNWLTRLTLVVTDISTQRRGRPSVAAASSLLQTRYRFQYTGAKQLTFSGRAVVPRLPTTHGREEGDEPYFPPVQITIPMRVVTVDDYYDIVGERGVLPGGAAAASTQGASSRTARERRARRAALADRDRRAAERSAEASDARRRVYARERQAEGVNRGVLTGIEMPDAHDIQRMTRQQYENFVQELDERVSVTPMLDLEPKKKRAWVQQRIGPPLFADYPVFPRPTRIGGNRVRLAWEAVVPNSIQAPNRRSIVHLSESHRRRLAADVPRSRTYNANDWLVARIGESNLDVDLIFGVGVERRWSRTIIQAGDLVDHELNERLWRLLDAALFIVDVVTLFRGGGTGRVMRAIRDRGRALRAGLARTARRLRPQAARDPVERFLGGVTAEERALHREVDDALDAIEAGNVPPGQGAMVGDLLHHSDRAEAVQTINRQRRARGLPDLPTRPGRTPSGAAVNPNPGWQSAHTTPQAGLRDLSDYDPGEMVTRLLPTGRGHAHTVFDQAWQREFRQIRSTTGQSQITAQEFADVIARAARDSGAFSAAEAQTVVDMIVDDLFFRLNLQPTSLVRIPGS